MRMEPVAMGRLQGGILRIDPVLSDCSLTRTHQTSDKHYPVTFEIRAISRRDPCAALGIR